MWNWHRGLAISTERVGTCLIELLLVVREATSTLKSLSRLLALEVTLLLNAPSRDFGKCSSQFGVAFFPWNEASVSRHHVVVLRHRFLVPHILVGSSIHVGITPSFRLFWFDGLGITCSSG